MVENQFERSVFAKSRTLEFFDDKELSMQLGPRHRWAVNMIKELIDNALDACEYAKVNPEIILTVDENYFSIHDNGCGMPENTIKKSLDYLVRVSDKNGYIAPTRGQLGNANKCIFAAAYVYTQEPTLIEIESLGMKHIININVDKIQGFPAIVHKVENEEIVKIGTFIKIHWRKIAT